MLVVSYHHSKVNSSKDQTVLNDQKDEDPGKMTSAEVIINESPQVELPDAAIQS